MWQQRSATPESACRAGSGRMMTGLVLLAGLLFFALVFAVPGAGAQVTLDTTNPPDGRVGEEYSHTFTASGGSGSYSFSRTGGTLPGGLSLDPGGELSGTPTTADTFEYTITVTDIVYSDSDAYGFTHVIRPPLLSVGEVKFDGGSACSPYSTANNYLHIEVRTNVAAEVSFGRVGTITEDGKIDTRYTGLELDYDDSGTDYLYTIGKYPLRPGSNTVSITVKQGWEREILRYTVNYPDAPTVGAEYYVGDVTGERRIQAFDKAVTLDLGRNNYLTDGTGAFAGNQSITVGVFGAPGSEPGGFVRISPVFRIKGAESDYRLGNPSELVLKYSGLGAAPESITVWRADAADFSSGENLGGLVSQRAGTITVQFEGEIGGDYAVFTSIVGGETYTDLPADGWYYHAVTALRAKGVMEPANNAWGYSSPGTNEFGLSSSYEMCRGEFAFMMVRALGLPLLNVTESSFTDVTESELGLTYVRAVETAAFHGLIAGFPNGEFHPRVDDEHGILTREQAAAIMARAAGLSLNTLEANVNASLARLYTDYESIPSWARSSVLACHRAGLMGGFPNGDGTYRFYDQPGVDELTRAQAASLVHRFMENQKLI